MVHLLFNHFRPREPIFKEELKRILNIKNSNTLNQTVSMLVKMGMIKRFINGVFFVPDSDPRFKDLGPSLSDFVEKRYLANDQGIRVGAYLVYAYKLTTQVPTTHKIITNHVSKNTRTKSMFDGRLIISAPKFELTSETIKYHTFLELIHAIPFSDFPFEKNLGRLREIMHDLNLDQKKLKFYSQYYQSNRLAYMFDYIERLV